MIDAVPAWSVVAADALIDAFSASPSSTKLTSPAVPGEVVTAICVVSPGIKVSVDGDANATCPVDDAVSSVGEGAITSVDEQPMWPRIESAHDASIIQLSKRIA